ncbi:MAG TPA: 4Fe-4S dicluster domain-containing protein [bacterium]|jgi:molybdopterin-containing oxidoreductase family iron-sulfur binding subunit
MSSVDKTPDIPKYWNRLSDLENPVGESHQERLFDAVEMARHAGNKRPGAALEAAGFMEEALIENGGGKAELSRRDFLKLSSAAVAFATAGCALRPTEKVIPYVKAPEEVTPGVPNYYASTLLDAAGTGVLVKTREGRPIKIEGNPDHPLSQGRLTARGQASIFNLYDPDRLTAPVALVPGQRVAPAQIPWQTADQEIGKALAEANGRIVLLTGTMHGPARMKLIQDFLATFPGARHVMADAWTHEATRNAQEMCYGKAVLPSYHFDKADYVLDLGSDFMGSGYSALQWQVDFGKARKVHDGKINKLVTFEPFMSMTGANADERYRVHPAKMLVVARAIAQAISSGNGHLADAEGEAGLPAGTLERVVQDLKANAGKGIVIAPDDDTLQLIANQLNSQLGNEGMTIDGASAPSQQSQGSHKDLFTLINDMRAGKVDVLIISGTNPGYWLPAVAGFDQAVSKVKTVVSLSDRIDETAASARYVLPGLHYLESWADSEPQVGLYGLTQPAIYPLYDNRSTEDSLIYFAKAGAKTGLATFAGDWHAYLMDTWKTWVYTAGRYDGTFENFWNSALRNGVLDTRSAEAARPRALQPTAYSVTSRQPAELELVVYPSPVHTDGHEANNAWLCECPDPVSKITWTNYASMSPVTGQKLGVLEGEMVRIEAQGMMIELPAHHQPGDVDGVISVQSGWGRTHAGKIGNGLGANGFFMRQPAGWSLKASGLACTLGKTGRMSEMANVQQHNATEDRPIIYEATVGDYQANPRSGHPDEETPRSLWKPWDYPGNRWGMRIDLSSCIGCHACTLACQVENNIPVVGAEETKRGRVMHWIRVDRYYSGDAANPDVVFQPMLCQHCENAPCETVCPVIATLHDNEGLNVQVYNRCVGTRYCSNNCPYKVRRFNWHEFSKAAYEQQPLKLALNPDVTVREKGVMEKCTFCFQRIRQAKQRAKDFGREVQDSDLKTACQQTCPTDAIVFGNFNNPDSQVSQEMRDERSYRVLEELDTRPSIAYWTKLRNRPGHGKKAGHEGGQA